MRNVIRAARAGFCFGVERAVDAIASALGDHQGSEIWTIGMPIHDPQEVGRLRAMGLRVAADVEEIPPGASVVIRAHGEPRAVFDALASRGADVTDMTCPFVRRAQELARSLSEQGYRVVVLGDREHPEVKGIVGNVGAPVDVVADEEEADELDARGRVALISQTTQRVERFRAVADVLAARAEELRACDTICRATVERQDAVRALAGKVDGVVLIGGRASANVRKLRDVAEASGLDVLWVEDEEELERGRGWFEGKQDIGAAAGASTPEWLIETICTKITTM